MLIKPICCVILYVWWSFIPLWAGADGLQGLEDVTIRVIDLDEIPNAGVQRIELPEPDLGELHDQVESVRLPGRGVFEQSGADFAETGQTAPTGDISPDNTAASDAASPADTVVPPAPK